MLSAVWENDVTSSFAINSHCGWIWTSPCWYFLNVNWKAVSRAVGGKPGRAITGGIETSRSPAHNIANINTPPTRITHYWHTPLNSPISFPTIITTKLQDFSPPLIKNSIYPISFPTTTKIESKTYSPIFFFSTCTKPDTTAHFRNTDLPTFIYEQQIYDDNVSMIVLG